MNLINIRFIFRHSEAVSLFRYMLAILVYIPQYPACRFAPKASVAEGRLYWVPEVAHKLLSEVCCQDWKNPLNCSTAI